MTALEIVKKWTSEEFPKYPPSQFNIGDVVRQIGDDEDNEEEHAMIIVGMRLRYYSHSRQHVWYYELADHISCPMVMVKDWFEADGLEKTTAQTEDHKWYITGGETQMVSVCECWQCHQIRVDDIMDCPYCSAESVPF